MISMLVATSSNGTGLEEAVAMLVWRTPLRGANQLVNAAGVLAAFEALRDKIARNRTGRAKRYGHGRFARAFPNRARPANLGAGCCPQPALCGCAHGQFGRHGATTRSPTQCLARWPIKTWGLCLGRLALVDRWYFTSLPTPGRCRGRASAEMECRAHGRGRPQGREFQRLSGSLGRAAGRSRGCRPG